LKRALGGVAPRTPFPIRIRNLGFYPNPHSPRVLFAAIEAPPDLPALARDIDQALAAIGVPGEQKAYNPHMTLARIKETVKLQKLQAAIAELPSLEFGDFEANRFYLYLSRMQPPASVYTKLSEFPLSK